MLDKSTSPEGLQPPEIELSRKAELLRATPLFVNNSEGAELIEKQMIFLALAGLKPVSEVWSAHYERGADGWRSVADDPEEVGQFLKSLGLRYALYGDSKCTMAAVSLESELVEEFRAAKGSSQVGRLLGFPDTAVSAYAEGKCLSIVEQDHIETVGIDWRLVPFRFSKTHWPEELEVARQWYETLVKYRLV